MALMNLKEAFRYQNKLKELMEGANEILCESKNILTVKTTHLRSQVVKEDPDVVVDSENVSDYAGHANEIARFLMALLTEREKLCKAIHEAKMGMDIDMDSETTLNRQRQYMARTFRNMTAFKSGEKVIPNGGFGYRFNGEGNQVTYRCDAKQVTTIDFDRNMIRKLAVEMNKKADEVSTKLDESMIATKVDHTPIFDINDSFDEILTEFIEGADKPE